ncbi:MAG: peptide chain release factor N(5)-glutamine methyltransferase [Clostridia bacterium]|nr:peptide chain release factor N(5)-glutamine methyltransferase [Clostridia bacterium]
MEHNIIDVLSECKKILKEHNIRLYDSDAEFIVASVIGKKRNELLPTLTISKDDYHMCIENCFRRSKHEPLDSILGFTEFYGLQVPFNKDTLTPRQETEILVDNVVKDIGSKNVKVLDLCSGSGCIGLAIAKSTKAFVYLSDISGVALDISMKNAKLNNVEVNYIKSDLFDSIADKFDVIVSNPPYIKTGDLDSLEEEVKLFDPMLALDGKEDGYYFYEKIIKDLKHHLNKNGKIYFEVGNTQAKYVSDLLKHDFKDITVIKDYSGVERIVTATLKD